MKLKICGRQILGGNGQMTGIKTTCPFYQTNLGEMPQEDSAGGG